MLVSKKYSTLDHCEWHLETMTEPSKFMVASAASKWQRTLIRDICQIHDIFPICGCKYTSICISKRNLLMNSFFILQFNYCRLVWMCHSRLMNNKIIRPPTQKKWLVLSTVTKLHPLKHKEGSVTIHKRNLKVLAKYCSWNKIVITWV